MISGLCYICGKPAMHTCRLCGRPVCDEHYNANGLCELCFKKSNIQ